MLKTAGSNIKNLLYIYTIYKYLHIEEISFNHVQLEGFYLYIYIIFYQTTKINNIYEN